MRFESKLRAMVDNVEVVPEYKVFEYLAPSISTFATCDRSYRLQ